MPLTLYMRFTKAFWWMVLLTILCAPWLRARAEDIALGSTKEQVITALGQPQGTLRKGSSELLVYKDVEIDLANGKVVKVYRTGQKTGSPRPQPVENSSARPASPPPATNTRIAPAPTPTPPPAVALPKPTPVPNQAQLTQKIAGNLMKQNTQPITPGRRAILIAGLVLFVIGMLVAVGAWIWFLVRAFGVGVGWGLACLFLPFAPIVFLVKYWEEGRKPFLINLGAAAGGGLGLFLAMTTAFGAESAPQSAGALPKQVVKEGTLANETLIRDAMKAVAFQVATLGCDHADKVKQYSVLSAPEGPEGARRWEERWIVEGCGGEYPVDIVFREDGPRSATYEVHSTK